VLELDQPAADRFEAKVMSGAEVVLIDALCDGHLRIIGELIEEQAACGKVRFVVGSSSIEYALTAHWRACGRLPQNSPIATVPAAERVLVVSGSCSPVTAAQIGTAREHGFECIALPPAVWQSGDVRTEVRHAVETLAGGRNVVVHAALGPDDSRIAEARQHIDCRAWSSTCHARLAKAMANIVSAAMTVGVRRIAVAGGDTSGYVARALDIEAMEFVAPLAPGSPLCRAVFSGNARPEIELCLKGGQVGGPDFFLKFARGN
jgi:uncharacterized protein YgbK (DUF1537 family)